MKRLLILILLGGSSSLYAQIQYSEENLFPKNESVSKKDQSKILLLAIYPNDNGIPQESKIEISHLDNMPIFLPPANDIKISFLLIPPEMMPNPLFNLRKKDLKD